MLIISTILPLSASRILSPTIISSTKVLPLPSIGNGWSSVAISACPLLKSSSLQPCTSLFLNSVSTFTNPPLCVSYTSKPAVEVSKYSALPRVFNSKPTSLIFSNKYLNLIYSSTPLYLILTSECSSTQPIYATSVSLSPGT